jgi:cytochrome c-type biogenesis protein CcmH/NrfG
MNRPSTKAERKMIELVIITTMFVIICGVFLRHCMLNTRVEDRYQQEVALNKQDAAAALKKVEQLYAQQSIAEDVYIEQKSDILTRYHADKSVSNQPLGQNRSAKLLIMLISFVWLASMSVYFIKGDVAEIELWQSLRDMAGDEEKMKAELFENAELTDQQKAERLLLLLRTKTFDHPEDVEGWRRLGGVLINMGALDQGRQAFQKAFELEPTNTTLFLEWVQYLFEKRDKALIDEAIYYLDKVLALNANHDSALIMKAFALDWIDKKQQAIAIWQSILDTRKPSQNVRDLLESNIKKAQSQLNGLDGITLAIHFPPSWQNSIVESDTIFVVVKSTDAAAPLAVFKSNRQALQSPIHLNDDHSMAPAFKLSSYKHGKVIVRVESGDKLSDASKLRFESDLLPFHTGQTQTVTISD